MISSFLVRLRILICLILLLPGMAYGDPLELYLLKAELSSGVTPQLERRYGRLPPLKPLPPALLETLRWALPSELALECPAQRAQAIQQWQLPNTSAVQVLVQEGLKRADAALLELRLSDALAELGKVRALIPCLSTRMEPAQVRQLFLLEAAARFYSNDAQADRYFAELLAVDARLFLEPEYPPKVQKVFFDVARKIARQTPTTVSFEGFEGRIFLNGLEVSSVRELAPGRHILQLEGPSGQLRGAMVRIPEAATLKQSRDVLSSRVSLNPPRAEQALSQLGQLLNRQQLPPSVLSALDHWLMTRNQDKLLIAFETSDGRYQLLLVERGQGVLEPSEERLASLMGGRVRASRTPSGTGAPEEPAEGPMRSRGGSLGVGLRMASGGDTLPVGHPTQPVLMVGGALPLSMLRLHLEVGLSLPGLGERQTSSACGSSLDEAGLAEAQAAALSCLPGAMSFQVAAGAGLPLQLGASLRLEPRVMVQALTLNEVVLKQDTPESWQVARVLAVGGNVGASLQYPLPLESFPIFLWARLEGGSVLVPSPLGISPLWVAGLQLGTEVAF